MQSHLSARKDLLPLSDPDDFWKSLFIFFNNHTEYTLFLYLCLCVIDNKL